MTPALTPERRAEAAATLERHRTARADARAARKGARPFGSETQTRIDTRTPLELAELEFQIAGNALTRCWRELAAAQGGDPLRVEMLTLRLARCESRLATTEEALHTVTTTTENTEGQN